MSTNFYDVIVLGGDLAATVAGAILAHRGFRVLHAGVSVDERYTIGTYVLPHAPLAFIGVDGPALKRVVGELNLIQLLRRRLEPNRPGFQLLLPDARIDVGDDLPRELNREAPEAVAAFDTVTTRISEISAVVESILAQDLILPPDGFWDRRDVSRVGARLPDDQIDLGEPLPPAHPLRVLDQLPAFFSADLELPGAIATARLGDLHRRGTFRLDGGKQGLRTLLLERLKTHSGEVRPDLTPEAIEVRRGRVASVRFVGASESFGCSHVLCGMGANEVARLLSGDRPPRRLLESAELEPAFYRYLLHLVAPLDSLPDALGLLAFAVRDRSAPFTEANALALRLTDGYGQHAVLSVEALVTDTSPAGLQATRRQIRAHIDALFPFVDRHLLAVHSPHDGLPPERIEAAASAPLPMEPVWRIPGERSLGIGAVPHATGIKHLLLASRQVLPGLGLEGEFATGWGAARLVLATDKKRDLVKGAVLEG